MLLVDALVDGIALDEIVLQHAVGPDAELHAPLTLHTIADGDDNIEVVKCSIICLVNISTNMCKICTCDISRQFFFLVDIVYMPANHRFYTINV